MAPNRRVKGHQKMQSPEKADEDVKVAESGVETPNHNSSITDMATSLPRQARPTTCCLYSPGNKTVAVDLELVYAESRSVSPNTRYGLLKRLGKSPQSRRRPQIFHTATHMLGLSVPSRIFSSGVQSVYF
ncbi:hypothetical protein MBM_08860 [Drepanopeziza brunnea f. sp. 'multigermtubi' MB_m1]|uniref:Uncharacterized protein n=1 Tax=Marssonina brunnea f. sp. multigermtubi (strain MB_m1) TaxID=1072389 RepID=K1WJ45_MARBU|nr:uncharacterized protein MBM_08860 [Drepanopeziza brunnea f. sp. 'multigermtubi' MB_m1]EKD12906.1 hypothetical protein MBM_08860 [Drepanopeziza brunnea f. sp. 'multigermtubi' MB_m1]